MIERLQIFLIEAKMRKLLISTSFILLVSQLSWGQAPAKEAQCRACHGDKGGAPLMDAYPKLQGQNKTYLVSALKSYKEGKRTGGMSAVMTGQAKMLSDDDINALADYYSKQ